MSTTSPPLDARSFRDTLGLFATGVAVIVARAGEEIHAMTVSAVSSLSLDPMLVLFCPGKTTRLAREVERVTAFTINFLRREQQALSTYFAGGWNEPAPPPYRFVASRSALRLEGSLASLDCEMERVTEAGDHWLVVGRVVHLHMGVQPHHPLLFFKGQYRGVDFADCAPAPDLANIHEVPFHYY
ncbi:MAG TPA: flavin reductase family protein [Steroidobacteraceae bacterium]